MTGNWSTSYFYKYVVQKSKKLHPRAWCKWPPQECQNVPGIRFDALSHVYCTACLSHHQVLHGMAHLEGLFSKTLGLSQKEKQCQFGFIVSLMFQLTSMGSNCQNLISKRPIRISEVARVQDNKIGLPCP